MAAAQEGANVTHACTSKLSAQPNFLSAGVGVRLHTYIPLSMKFKPSSHVETTKDIQTSFRPTTRHTVSIHP